MLAPAGDVEVARPIAYDGSGLLAARSDGTTTTQHFTCDLGEAIPLLLDDGRNSYLYGPGGQPFEQISGPRARTRN